jgi:RNA polymerase sigma-70 factor (ECF subfamily)
VHFPLPSSDASAALMFAAQLDKLVGRGDCAGALAGGFSKSLEGMEIEPDVTALMAAYARGDDKAFAPLFRAVAPRLMAFFRRSTSDAALREDLLQATFIRLHSARDRYREGAPLWPWLFTIAARVRIDELRKVGRRPRAAGEHELEHLQAEEDPEEGGAGIDRAAEAKSVRDALDSLTESHRSVIHLHRFEGLSFAEIGAALGISEGAARIRAFRAYAQLRERLRPFVQKGS